MDADDELASIASAADTAKELANAAYKRGEYALAVKKYGVALRHAAQLPERRPGKLECTRTAQLLANRCMAHLGLGDNRAALTDAEQAVRASPDWPKAHFRHGTVLMRLKSYTKAYASFKRGHHLDMSNQELTLACQQAHQKMVGLESDNKLMSQEELIKMRDRKCEEEKRERAAQAEGRRAALAAAANEASAGSGASYREEALRRTEQMARGRPSTCQSAARADTDAAAPSPPTRAACTSPDAAREPAPTVPVPTVPAPTVPAPTVPVPTVPVPTVPVPAAPALVPQEAPTPPTPAAMESAHPPPEAPSALASPAMSPPEFELSSADERTLVLSVALPAVSGMRELALSLSSDRVVLECTAVEGAAAKGSPPAYAPLHLALPSPIDEESASARFDKRRSALVVRMPLAQAAADADAQGQLV